MNSILWALLFSLCAGGLFWWLLLRRRRSPKYYYLKKLKEMKGAVRETRHLSRAFPESWFEEAKRIIRSWDYSQGSLTMQTHTAFIGFCQTSLWSDRNLIAVLDDAFEHLSVAANRALSRKLRLVAGDVDNYFSTVFEILMVSAFAEEGLLVDYEPNVGSGVPEARVQIENSDVIIEAMATADTYIPDGPIDPHWHARKWARKILDKCSGQLSAVQEPCVLFFGGNIATNQLFEEAMLTRVQNQPQSSVLSAIVIADSFMPTRYKIWMHPDPQFSLSSGSARRLKELFNAEDFEFRMFGD